MCADALRHLSDVPGDRPIHINDGATRVDATSDRDGWLRGLLGLVLAATIVGGGIDLYLDAPDSWRSPHVVYEIVLIAAALVTSALLWHGWWRARRTLTATQRMLAEHAAERDAWRESAQT